LAKAQQRHDQEAITELQAIGPPPYHDIQQWFSERKWANAAESGGGSNAAFLEALLFAPHYTLHDAYSWVMGLEEENAYFNGTDMKGPWMALNLATTDTNFSIPVFVIQGADDDIKPVAVARKYFDAISAPHKEFIEIQNAGHSVSVTHSDEFLSELIAKVRPLALEH
jgi:pimeloyl-ACP methyl ester carboxylesterase